MKILPITAVIVPGSKVRFDPYLSAFDSADIKRVTRLYVGKEVNKLRKDECGRAMRSALTNPDLLRGLYANLSEFERFALYLVRRAGGSVSGAELAGSLWMSGHTFRYPYGGEPDFASPLDTLQARGLVFVARPPGEYWHYRHDPGLPGQLRGATAFADERLLEHAERCTPRAIEITPVGAPARWVVKRPAEVTLMLGKVVETIARKSSVSVTASGRLAKPGLGQIARALGPEVAAVSELEVALPEAGVSLPLCSARPGCSPGVRGRGKRW